MTCPLCGSPQATKLYDLSDGYATVRCGGCGFVHMSPRPTQDYLNAYYESATVYAYGSDHPDDYRNAIEDKKTLIDGFLKALPDAARSGLAVDYGAGQGAAVKALSEMGYEAVGIEISSKARAAAESLFGVTMIDGDLSACEDDAIALLTMFDILEHLLEPRAFVETALKKLKPGGAALIGVPNYDALDRMLRGAGSKALIFPEHVNQFTASSLRGLFQSCGYKVDYVGSPPPYGVAITLGLRRGLLKTFGRNPLTFALRDALVWIKRYLVYPLPNAFVEKSGLFGQSLLILAHRPESL